MTVQECYIRMDGDYEDAIRRLRNDERLKKFLTKLPADHSFADLCTALSEQNYAAAFRAAHTLKGISLNLSLTPLAKSSSTLTEVLRAERADDRIAELFRQVQADYQKTMAAIAGLLDA